MQLAGRNTARVKTNGEIVREYEFHTESKCAGADGRACDKHTVGLPKRRHIQIHSIRYIGKESNSLEAVDAGLIHSKQNVYPEYTDPRRDEWQMRVLPALQTLPLSGLVKASGISRRALLDIRVGRSRPHLNNLERLAAIVRK